MSGHPLAAGQAQNSESSPAKDRLSTTVLRNQPGKELNNMQLYRVATGLDSSVGRVLNCIGQVTSGRQLF